MVRDQNARTGIVLRNEKRLLITLSILFSFGAPWMVQGQGVTFKGENVSIYDVIRFAKTQGHVIFTYDTDNFYSAPHLNINLFEVSPDSLIKTALYGSPLEAVLCGSKSILIYPRSGPGSTHWPFYGKVVGIDGKPLEGATIEVTNEKGKQLSFITADANGWFRVSVPSLPSCTLHISYTGYSTKELFVYDNRYINVRLEREIRPLDEVVVLLYGYTTRRQNTGSISAVNHAELIQSPVSDPLGALEGRMPGLLIAQRNGVAGSGFQVLIRGLNSISHGNLPLFLIDGVPLPPGSDALSVIPSPSALGLGGISALGGLSIADIDSIEVLKDADATAIYGSRAANGAILITTRKPKLGTDGKISSVWSVTVLGGGSAPAQTDRPLNAAQYLAMRKEAIANDGATPGAINAPDILLLDPTRYTDFRDMTIDNPSLFRQAHISVMGGDSRFGYLLSGNYHNQTIPFPNNPGETLLSGFLSLRYESLDKRLLIQGSGILSGYDNREPVNDPTRYMFLAPDVPPFLDANHNPVWETPGGSMINIPAEQLKVYRVHGQDLFSHIDAAYKIWPWLDARASLGYHAMTTGETSIQPKAAQDPMSIPAPTGSYFSGSTNLNGFIGEPQLEYHEKHGQNAWSFLVGGTMETEHNKQGTVSATNYTSDDYLGMLSKAPTLTETLGDSLYLYEALFFRAHFQSRDKYFLNLAGRRDGSSRFGPGRQFGDFWSVGGAWIFREEPWFPDISWLSFGKLRGSYGVTGNDQIGNYQYAQSWMAGRVLYDSARGYYPSNAASPNLGWEVIHKMEGAIELGAWQDRIFLSAAWFRHWSTNQLLNNRLPTQTGISSMLSNIPVDVENTGWEFVLREQSKNTARVKWNTSFSLTIPRNKLRSFPGLASSSYANSLYLGKSITTITAYQYTGVDQAKGVFTFKDLNGDGKYDSRDLMAGGNTDVKAYAGWDNSVAWKNWQVTVFIEARKQLGQNAMTPFYLPFAPGEKTPGMLNNLPVTALKRWQKPGDVAPFEKFTDSAGSAAAIAASLYAESTAVLTDASFIRIKTIEIAYTLPPGKLGGWLKGCRVFVQGQNLWRLTRYAVTDPETQNAYTLPPLRTLVAGMTVSF